MEKIYEKQNLLIGAHLVKNDKGEIVGVEKDGRTFYISEWELKQEEVISGVLADIPNISAPILEIMGTPAQKRSKKQKDIISSFTVKWLEKTMILLRVGSSLELLGIDNFLRSSIFVGCHPGGKKIFLERCYYPTKGILRNLPFGTKVCCKLIVRYYQRKTLEGKNELKLVLDFYPTPNEEVNYQKINFKSEKNSSPVPAYQIKIPHTNYYVSVFQK